MRLVDTHCHLTSARFAADLDAVVARMVAGGVEAALTIATGLDDARAAAAVCARFPGQVAMAAGIDPHSAQAADPAAALAGLEALAASGALRAIGEFGFEWHHDVGDAPAQLAWVEAQLALARRRDLPVVLHARSGRGRDAHADMLAALDRHPGVRGVIHSFDGDAATAAAYVARGLHVAVNGMITFKANHGLRAALAAVPAERLLVETDAPYLSPEPHRGSRNEPARVALVAGAVAQALGQPAAAIAERTAANAAALFGLP